jgi:hypothetical protein
MAAPVGGRLPGGIQRPRPAQPPDPARRPPPGYFGGWAKKPKLAHPELFNVIRRGPEAGGLYFARRRRRPVAVPAPAPRPARPVQQPAPPDPLAGLTDVQRGDIASYDAETAAKQKQLEAIFADVARQASADADAAKNRLGALAQMAGQTSTLPQWLHVPSETVALPSVLSQDAQQRALTESALAVDTAGKLPSLVRAGGATEMARYLAERLAGRSDLISEYRKQASDAEQAAADRAVELRKQNLQYLGDVIRSRTNVDVERIRSRDRGADRIAKLKAERARLENALRIARENNDRARENALLNQQAAVDRALAAERGRRQRNYAKLKADWVRQVPELISGKRRAPTGLGDPGGWEVRPMTRRQVVAQGIAAGITPLDALNAVMAATPNAVDLLVKLYRGMYGPGQERERRIAEDLFNAYADVYDTLEAKVGRARARRALKKLTSIDPAWLEAGPPPPQTGEG